MLAFRLFHRLFSAVYYTTQKKLLLSSLVLVLLGGCSSQVVQPTPVRLATAPVVATTATPAQAAVQVTPSKAAPTATTQPLPTLQPQQPELLINADPTLPIIGLGPLAPSKQWLVTLHAGTEPVFQIQSLREREASLLNGEVGVVQGLAFMWSPDGSLLLYRANADPATVLALEPTTALSATILVSNYGAVEGFAWLRSALMFATNTDGQMRLIESNGTEQTLVAQLKQRELLPNGLIAAPDDQQLALIVADPVSETVELHRFDQSTGDFILVDTAPQIVDYPVQAVWDRFGHLVYDIGGGVRQFEPTFNYVVPAGINGRVLTWTERGFLIRQFDTGRLLRWQSDGTILPFGSTESPVIVEDAQVFEQAEVLFLINGEVWRFQLM